MTSRHRGYGAKDMVRRFGMERLVEAISAAKFNGLDLSHIQPPIRAWRNGADH
jgi:hypothetical protein